MNAYTCPHCKKPYYSAAEPEFWTDTKCPECGKDLKEDEDAELPRPNPRTENPNA
jgi:transcription initiation factor IIE alpha subunit